MNSMIFCALKLFIRLFEANGNEKQNQIKTVFQDSFENLDWCQNKTDNFYLIPKLVWYKIGLIYYTFKTFRTSVQTLAREKNFPLVEGSNQTYAITS